MLSDKFLEDCIRFARRYVEAQSSRQGCSSLPDHHRVHGPFVIRAVTSSSDSGKATSTTFTTPVGLVKTSSATEPSPTSSIASNTGSDDMASRLSAGGSRSKGSRREKGDNAVDVEKAKMARIETQGLLGNVGALAALLDRVWKALDNRVLRQPRRH